MNTVTRVALVEDHVILAEALRVALSLKGCEVVSVPVSRAQGSRSALLAAIVEEQPRVVLLDLDLGPAGDGVSLIQPLSRGGHHVVILTACEDRVRWGAALAQGAATVLTKAAPLQVILDVIDRVDHGLPVIPRPERERLVQLWRAHHPVDDERQRRLRRLTPREAYVLGELVRGKRVREVAADAVVSEATVRTQVKSILAKLGVSSQLAAVAVAREVGWPPPSPAPSAEMTRAAGRNGHRPSPPTSAPASAPPGGRSMPPGARGVPPGPRNAPPGAPRHGKRP